MAEVPALNIRINIDGAALKAGVQKAITAMKQLSASADKDIVNLKKRFDDFGRTASRSLKIATAAVGALALKLGKDAVQAAMADEKSQALLANTLRNTTGATTAAIAGVEDYITALQKSTSVADDELRPALARLATATGSVDMAQNLMGTALNVSAFAGTDLASASDAIIKATKGQFKALQMLVPGISLATVKSKDLGKVFEEVGRITAGSAATRTQTFEYRVKGLRIAFGEILETLGYRLLPVLEKFANQLSTKILPQIQTFITLNQDKLAASLALVAEFGLKFLTVLIYIGNWIANNTALVKNIAILFASMFVVTKVYGMITAINLLTAALVRMNVAMGAGAIGAMTKGAAKGGMFATLGVALAGGGFANKLGEKLGDKVFGGIPGTKAYKDRVAKDAAKAQDKLFGANLPKSPSPLDITNGIKATSSSQSTTTDDLAKWLKKITEELKKANAKSTASNVQYVTVYASDTNDIAKNLSKAAKNGVPTGSAVGASTSSSTKRGGSSGLRAE